MILPQKGNQLLVVYTAGTVLWRGESRVSNVTCVELNTTRIQQSINQSINGRGEEEVLLFFSWQYPRPIPYVENADVRACKCYFSLSRSIQNAAAAAAAAAATLLVSHQRWLSIHFSSSSARTTIGHNNNNNNENNNKCRTPNDYYFTLAGSGARSLSISYQKN